MGAALWVAACSDAPAAPDVDEDPGPAGVVIGRAHALGGGTVTGVTARVVWNQQEATAPVNTDGTFAVPMPDEVNGFGFLTLEPDAGSALHPAWVLLSPGDLDGMGSVLLLPNSWTIASGDYAGSAVDIDPTLATEARVMPGFWGTLFPYEQDGFLQTVVDRTVWSGEFASWRPEHYPVPVALDRPGSSAPISEADSALFWSHLDRMEEALGRDVFLPSRIEDVTVLGGRRRADGAVLIQIDTAQVSPGIGLADKPEPWAWSLTAQADAWSGGSVTRIGFLSDDIQGARAAFKSSTQLEDRQLVIHEMMHTLGAGHGCAWPSVQTYCDSLRTELPSAEDVAHLEVLEAARALEGELGTRWGLISAVIGHRVVTRGLTPVPDLELVYGPANVGR